MPEELGVETLDRRRLDQIERLALRHAFRDVEHDDVAELLEADEERQRAADLTRADQCDFAYAPSDKYPRLVEDGPAVAVISPFG